MGKCLALTTGRFSFFPLWPCGKREVRAAQTAGMSVLPWPSMKGRAWIICFFSSHALTPMAHQWSPFIKISVLSYLGEEGEWVVERGVTQKSRPCLKRPIVFPIVEQGCGISGSEEEKVSV